MQTVLGGLRELLNGKCRYVHNIHSSGNVMCQLPELAAIPLIIMAYMYIFTSLVPRLPPKKLGSQGTRLHIHDIHIPHPQY